MRGRIERFIIVAVLSLVVIGFYSTTKIVFAKGGTTSASGWEKHDNGNGECEHGKKFKCNKCKKRCVRLQKETLGKQQKGNININGTMIATKFVGDGSMLTGIGSGRLVGAILMYGGISAPSNYLICDGAEVSRTTYADLFTVIGITFGLGDGSTTFNLPDMRQRFALGKADSGTGSTLGEIGGAIDHNHTYNTVIEHTHNIDPPNITTTANGTHEHDLSGGSPGSRAPSIGEPQGGRAAPTYPSGDHSHNVNIPSFSSDSTGSASGTTSTNNPPYLVVNYIIKY